MKSKNKIFTEKPLLDDAMGCSRYNNSYRAFDISHLHIGCILLGRIHIGRHFMANIWTDFSW